MDIRHATNTDLDFAAPLMLQTQRAHVEAFPHRYRPITIEDARSHLRAVLDDDTKRMLVATRHETRLGYTVFDFVDVAGSVMLQARRYCYVHDIGVASEARREGVARALLDQVYEASRQAGIDEVELDVWAFNATARRSFERSGFEVFGTKMRRSLGST